MALKNAKVVTAEAVAADSRNSYFNRGISSQPGVVIFEDTFNQKDAAGKSTEMPFWYAAPRDPEAFKSFVNSLTGESLEDAYSLYMYATDLKGRAAERETKAAESTIVKRDGKDIDIFALPVEKMVGAINAAFTLAAAIPGDEPQRAFVVSRRKALEAGMVREQNGLLVVNKEGGAPTGGPRK